MNEKRQIKLLLVFIASLMVFFLLLLHAYFEGGIYTVETWSVLARNLIPELLGTLIPFLAIYYFLVRNGVDVNDTLTEKGTLWLSEGFESYSDISWSSCIQQSNKITFCAFYIDNWIENNMSEFIDFLNRKNTKLVVYLPDYTKKETLANIRKIIPAYTEKNLEHRIIGSIDKIKTIMKQEKIDSNKVRISLYPHVFNYTFESFDDKNLFLSINEICRTKTYQSPFFKMDISRSDKISRFYRDEIKNLNKLSKKVDI